jgi:hypothetical protein
MCYLEIAHVLRDRSNSAVIDGCLRKDAAFNWEEGQQMRYAAVDDVQLDSVQRLKAEGGFADGNTISDPRALANPLL